MQLKIIMVVSDITSDDKPSFQPFIKSQIDSIRALGHKVEIFNVQGPKFGGNYLTKMIPLYSFSRKFKPDIVHSHYAYCSLTALSSLPYPQVISILGDEILGRPDEKGRKKLWSYIQRPIPWFTSKFASHIIVKSEEMRHQVNNNNISVVPNGVDFQTFYPIDKLKARKTLNLAEDKTYILFPADTKDSRKRFSLAKESCKLLRDNYNVDHEIIAVRTLSQNQFNLYLNACDALIFTSWSEGSPNVIKEAMAANTPIITVEVGDTKSVIANTNNCYIVEDNPQKIAERLYITLKDGRRSNGRDLVSHLEISRVAKQVESIYYSVLKTINR